MLTCESIGLAMLFRTLYEDKVGQTTVMDPIPYVENPTFYYIGTVDPFGYVTSTALGRVGSPTAESLINTEV